MLNLFIFLLDVRFTLCWPRQILGTKLQQHLLVAPLVLAMKGSYNLPFLGHPFFKSNYLNVNCDGNLKVRGAVASLRPCSELGWLWNEPSPKSVFLIKWGTNVPYAIYIRFQITWPSPYLKEKGQQSKKKKKKKKKNHFSILICCKTAQIHKEISSQRTIFSMRTDVLYVCHKTWTEMVNFRW